MGMNTNIQQEMLVLLLQDNIVQPSNQMNITDVGFVKAE